MMGIAVCTGAESGNGVSFQTVPRLKINRDSRRYRKILPSFASLRLGVRSFFLIRVLACTCVGYANICWLLQRCGYDKVQRKE